MDLQDLLDQANAKVAKGVPWRMRLSRWARNRCVQCDSPVKMPGGMFAEKLCTAYPKHNVYHTDDHLFAILWILAVAIGVGIFWARAFGWFENSDVRKILSDPYERGLNLND